MEEYSTLAKIGIAILISSTGTVVLLFPVFLLEYNNPESDKVAKTLYSLVGIAIGGAFLFLLDMLISALPPLLDTLRLSILNTQLL